MDIIFRKPLHNFPALVMLVLLAVYLLFTLPTMGSTLITEYHSEITLQTNNTLLAKEEITFTGMNKNTFTHLLRNLPLLIRAQSGQYHLRQVEVSGATFDGASIPVVKARTNNQIEIGGDDRAPDSFLPQPSPGIHTLVVRHRG